MGANSTLSPQHEQALVDHIQLMELALFGLDTEDVRKFAYSLATELNIENKFNHTSKMAGRDRLNSFMKRHPELSISTPQATSMARAVGFNWPKVAQFFDIYKDILAKGNFTADNIWNADETGISNVH